MRLISDLDSPADGAAVDDADEPSAPDPTVQIDPASERVTFRTSWRASGDSASGGHAGGTLALVLRASALDRYATLDANARTRVRAMLHGIAEHALDGLSEPPPGRERTLVIEVTDAMLDAATRVH